MPLVATRGCPYQCTFCSSPFMWTTRYVMRSIPIVVDEIEHYMKEYKADNIDFFDLTAIVKKDWILEFCREIKRRQAPERRPLGGKRGQRRFAVTAAVPVEVVTIGKFISQFQNRRVRVHFIT